MEIVITIILLTIGGSIAINRAVKKAVSQNRNGNLLKKAEADVAFLHELIDSVEIPYKSFDCTQLDAEKLAASLRSTRLEKEYEIIKILPSHHRLLIYTGCKYEDWDTGWKGETTHVQKSRQDFFAVKFDSENRRLSIYGPMFNDNKEKFVFEKFVAHIKNLV